MKMNKKGFTLIEMLVVIAIIAVLVSIIIPTVMSSTDKAAAATDAANLRSAKASIVTAILLKGDNAAVADGNATSYERLVGEKAPASKSGAGEFKYTISNKGVVEVMFGTKKIADFAVDAGGPTEANS